MKLENYVPTLYEDIDEMNALIQAEQPEFETNLKTDIQNSFKNNFVNLADETGISNYEKILGITPNETDTLETRRSVVYARLLNNTPFTIKSLHKMLNDIFGAENIALEYSYNQYYMRVTITTPGNTWYNQLYTILKNIVPCNINWVIMVYRQSWKQVKATYTTWQALYDTEKTWNDVLYGT